MVGVPVLGRRRTQAAFVHVPAAAYLGGNPTLGQARRGDPQPLGGGSPAFAQRWRGVWHSALHRVGAETVFDLVTWLDELMSLPL